MGLFQGKLIFWGGGGEFVIPNGLGLTTKTA